MELYVLTGIGTYWHVLACFDPFGLWMRRRRRKRNLLFISTIFLTDITQFEFPDTFAVPWLAQFVLTFDQSQTFAKITHRRQKTHNFFVKIWQIWSKNSLSCRKMLEAKKNSEKDNKKLKKDNKKLMKWKKLKKL